MTCNVAFIGLGVMGYPMAGYISKAGHNVTVFNRTTAKAEKWVNEYKGKMAETPAEAAKDAEYILEKKKHEKAKSGITNKENLNTFTSSIFFPNHIKRILLNNVAEA